MKKFITLMLSAMLVMSSSSALAFTDMEDSKASILTERLGIISGYEDGTFRPENEVTRAEAAAIIIKARGYSDEDISNYREEMRTEQYIYREEERDIRKFADYNPNHWANVYLQLAVENNIISGFDDNTLRPDDKVTIAQLLTMLVSSVGYEEYAKSSGGYPGGYIQWAEATGITQGLGSFDHSKNATRKEILDCAANTLEVPVCIISGYSVAWNGEMMPELEIKDGTGRDFQNLLTHMFNVYTAEGTADEIADKNLTAHITKSVNFDNKAVSEDDKLTAKIKLNSKTEIKTNKKYNMYIKVNDSEEKDYELVCAFPIE